MGTNYTMNGEKKKKKGKYLLEFKVFIKSRTERKKLLLNRIRK